MDRRDFLDPRRLAESAGQMIGAAQSIQGTSADSGPDVEITLVRYARSAMGTVFEIVLPFGHGVPTAIIHEAFDLIDEIESRLTVYRESSEVCALNQKGYAESVAVSSELFGLLELSQRLSEATGGAFDVTSGALVAAWGFVRGPRRVPSYAERVEALTRCGWKHLQLEKKNTSVRFAVPGLVINLGSIGKGYALDRVADFFRERCPGQPVLLHGGKSSVLGIGTPPGYRQGWSVVVEHPWHPHAHLGTVNLNDRAMATSAATFKHLVHQGKKLGHILDPRTGWPASGTASATAMAPQAAVADALSTAFFVLGDEAARAFCQAHPEIDTLIMPEIR